MQDAVRLWRCLACAGLALLAACAGGGSAPPPVQSFLGRHMQEVEEAYGRAGRVEPAAGGGLDFHYRRESVPARAFCDTIFTADAKGLVVDVRQSGGDCRRLMFREAGAM